MKVAVLGAKGRMGSTVVDAITGAPDMECVCALDAGDDLTAVVDSGATVVVDFTVPTSTVDNVVAMVNAGISCVVGTSGWDEQSMARVRDALAQQPQVGVLIAPNFTLGAVLMMSFAQQAARLFESAEIIELHHPDKVDAPSGTATSTAQRIAAARQGMPAMPDATTTALEGARGSKVDGVTVHSVRLRGLTAHQEVIFGNPGETLTIRHDSFDRAGFMPGVLLGIRRVQDHPGLTVGLENFLDLS